MTAELDAMIDRIQRKSLAERRIPTPDEAKQVGYLAVCLARKKLHLPAVSQPSSLGYRGLPAAAVPDSPIHRQPAVKVCRRSTFADDCSPPDRPLPSPAARKITLCNDRPQASAAQWSGCEKTSPDNKLKERTNRLLRSKAQTRLVMTRMSGGAADAGKSQPHPRDVAWLPQQTRSTTGGPNAVGGGLRQAAGISIVRSGHNAEQRPMATKSQLTTRPPSCDAEAGKSLPHPLGAARLPQPARSAARGFRQATAGRPVAGSPVQYRCPTATKPCGAVTPAGGRVDVVQVAADKGRAQPGPLKPSSSKSDVIQTASKAAANSPQTPKSPPKRTVSSVSSSSSDKSSSRRSSTTTGSFRDLLDIQLRDRLSDLRLSRDEVSQNKHIVKELRENILAELMSNSHYRLYSWETVNSGSYYDKTKIGKPDEYDCMFTCLIRAECKYHPTSPSKSYAGLRIPTTSNWKPSELLSNCDDDKVFICPRAFKAYFRQHVERALYRPSCSLAAAGKRIVIRQDNGVGPAVTVDVECAASRYTILSVDMVPAVRLLEWPDPAKNWTSCWLSSEIVSGIKRPEHHKSVKPSVVPKIHPTEYETKKGWCKWWRLSFSAVEKKIVKHADGTCSQDKGHTCRKNVLRLLKDDLAKFYENNKLFDKDKKICSYFLKTIILGLWEEQSQSWADSDLLPRYVNALERTVQCLKDRNIEHFFIDSENLLDEKEISDAELSTVTEYFQGILTGYSE